MIGPAAPSRAPRALASIASLVLASWLLAGCAGSDRLDITDGVRVTVSVADPERMRFERFELLEDGSFKWGGGRDALRDETSWGTQLDEPCARRLVSLMRSSGWIPGPPERPSDSGRTAAREGAANELVTVAGRDDGMRFKWTEASDLTRIEEVLAALAEVASRRDAERVNRLARPPRTR